MKTESEDPAKDRLPDDDSGRGGTAPFGGKPGPQSHEPNSAQPPRRDIPDGSEPVPSPLDAFVEPWTDPFNNSDVWHREKNVFAYGEVIGRVFSGSRIKTFVSKLFALISGGVARNPSAYEVALTRVTIRVAAKRLVLIAPFAVVVDVMEAFAKERMGTAGFYGKLDMAVLGGVGGFLGGAVFDAFGLGLLASFGLSGVALFVAAPLVFGILGAVVFQVAGSWLFHQNLSGTPPDSWAQSFFTWLSNITSHGKPVALTDGHRASKKQAQLPPAPHKLKFELPVPDPGTNRRRPPQQFLPFFPPWRGGPGGASGNGGGRGPGDDGPDGDDGGGGGGRGGPPPPPGGAGVLSGRRVGGVLFENCHQVLTGIEELTGAYWDESTQSLVLIGKDSDTSGRRHLTLPAMDADHFKVALRAALIGESLGVSIDAPAEYRYGENGRRMPPSGTPFFVSYLGGSAGTLSGAIFFEADRIMKCLSLGIDNNTGNSFQAGVPGFRSGFDMHHDNDDSKRTSWHRFWFVVERVELRQCAQSKALTFGEIKIAIKTELELRGSAKRHVVDPLDEQFARHLTLHYDEYAKEFPVFGRLKELAKVSALASFVVNQGIEIDLGDILSTPPIEVLTPDTTPSLLRSEYSLDGDCIRTHMMSGGVDFRIAPEIMQDFDGFGARLRIGAGASRLTFRHEWSFRVGKDDLLAKAVRVGPRKQFRPVQRDHIFPVIEGLPRLELQRVYEPSRTTVGMFGPSWCPLLPWSLTILNGSAKRSEVVNPDCKAKAAHSSSILLLRGGRSAKTQVYRPLTNASAEDGLTWGRVTSSRVRQDGSSFHYDPQDLIKNEAGRFLFMANGRNHYFDESGRLVEISCGAGLIARYVWEGKRLVKIENNAGQWYSFLYCEQLDVVKEVTTSDGEILHYIYDEDVRLQEVLISSHRLWFYSYDMSARLNEVNDSTGAVTHRVFYKANGEPIDDAAVDRIDLPEGGQITRIFSDGRLTSLADQCGTRAELTYGPKGNLQAIFVQNRVGLNWRLDYGINNTMRRIVDPLGRATQFEFDQPRQVAFVVLPDKRKVSVKQGDNGGDLEVSTPGADGWTALFDPLGNLTSICGPTVKKRDLNHGHEVVSVLDEPGECRKVTFPVGPQFNLFFSSVGFRFEGIDLEEQVGRPFVGRHRIKCTVGSDGRSFTMEGLAGSVKASASPTNSTALVVEFASSLENQLPPSCFNSCLYL
ncbi:MAG: hypothetical protein ABSA83_22740 [Verrucomicrobiota bacterium]